MEQFNSFTVPIKKEKSESFTAIIIADKKFGPLAEYEGSTIIDTHINQIQSICKNQDIVYIGGQESIKVKDRFPGIRVIENYNFTNTNDASNIRLAMMYNTSDTIVLMKCGALIDNMKFNTLIQHNKNCTVAGSKDNKHILGITVTSGRAEFIAFGLQYEWIPICLFNKKQVAEFYRTVFKHKPNYMFHELINKHLENNEMEVIL